jgi:hypothetical protein
MKLVKKFLALYRTKKFMFSKSPETYPRAKKIKSTKFKM